MGPVCFLTFGRRSANESNFGHPIFRLLEEPLLFMVEKMISVLEATQDPWLTVMQDQELVAALLVLLNSQKKKSLIQEDSDGDGEEDEHSRHCSHSINEG